jgi:hypothetical protein
LTEISQARRLLNEFQQQARERMEVAQAIHTELVKYINYLRS